MEHINIFMHILYIKRIMRQAVLVSLMLCFAMAGAVLASGPKLGVFYPEYPEPYNVIFERIIKGIESQAGKLVRFPIKDNVLQRAMHNNYELDGIIALGEESAHIAEQNTALPIVVGAVPMVPKPFSGVGLSPSPKELFKIVNEVLPEIKKIHIVYSEKYCKKLVKIAYRDLKGSNLILESHQADTKTEALLIYRTLSKSINPETDLIWLPLDLITVDETAVLPMLLQLSWERSLKILSSKPAHSRSGTLISAYPDNFGLGQQLVDVFNRHIESPSERITVPSSKLSLAVNTRTADHLGVDFSRKQLEDFELVYPAK